ncbi:hypothetical protein BM590_A1340 [Brucella melitensis M5-90]|nr:conserved hypothetical protein [Brucella melitensis M28]ADZ87284.1 hypothetical protein BM590_A1340 [Brucella melitensis M5-90]AEQ08915.1 hypothetical protein BMNI_I1296 [Brucella melitensis NI]
MIAALVIATLVVLAHLMMALVATMGHLCGAHFMAVELSIVIAIQRSEFFLALILDFIQRYLAVTIHIETALHAVGRAAYDTLEGEGLDFISRQVTVAISIGSLELVHTGEFLKIDRTALVFRILIA